MPSIRSALAPVTRIAPTLASTIAFTASKTVSSPPIRITSPPLSARIFATSAMDSTVANRRAAVKTGRMQKRDVFGTPALREHGDERGRRDQDRRDRALPAPLGVPRGRPAQQSSAGDDPRVAVLHDERAVGQLAEPGRRVELRPRARCDAFRMQLGVDLVRATRRRVELVPGGTETDVVLAAAERTRTVTRGERCCLVEEEELRKAPGLHQRPPK